MLRMILGEPESSINSLDQPKDTTELYNLQLPLLIGSLKHVCKYSHS